MSKEKLEAPQIRSKQVASHKHKINNFAVICHKANT